MEPQFAVANEQLGVVDELRQDFYASTYRTGGGQSPSLKLAADSEPPCQRINGLSAVFEQLRGFPAVINKVSAFHHRHPICCSCIMRSCLIVLSCCRRS